MIGSVGGFEQQNESALCPFLQTPDETEPVLETSGSNTDKHIIRQTVWTRQARVSFQLRI